MNSIMYKFYLVLILFNMNYITITIEIALTGTNVTYNGITFSCLYNFG